MGKSLTKYWYMWLITALFYALDYFQHTAPSVLIEPIADSLQTDIIHVGNILSIYFPIYALFQIPAGYILDRYQIKYVLCTACILVSLGLLSLDTGTLFMLVIGRACIAIGSSFAFLGSLKAATIWLPPRFFSLAVGLTNTIGVVGGLFGQPILNHFITQYDWRRSILFISVFGLILACCIMFFLQYNYPPKNHKFKPLSLRALKIKISAQTWFLAIYSGIMVGTIVNAFSELYDVVFLEQSLNITSQQAANISALIFVGIAFGGPFHGYLTRHLKNIRNWMLLSCLLTIVSFSAAIFSSILTTSYTIIYCLYFSVGFFVSSMLLAFHVAKLQETESNHATTFAVINMVIGLCGWFFQFSLGEAIRFFRLQFNGDLNIIVFFNAFWILLIPLFISFFFCYKIKLPPPNKTRLIKNLIPPKSQQTNFQRR